MMAVVVVKQPYIQKFVYTVVGTVGWIVVGTVAWTQAEKAYVALKAKWDAV